MEPTSALISEGERASALPVEGEQLLAWQAFLRAHSMMLRRIGNDLEAAELPPLAWYEVLAALNDADGPLRQVELADSLLISHSGLSRLVDRIEAAGLIERVRCPSDRRSVHVALTAEGEGMLERMAPVYMRGIAEDFLPALGKDPCEIRKALEAIAGSCESARE